MELDLTSKRAKKLIREHGLTEEEIQQIVASARINLATFDPEYRTNVTQIADDLQKSRPTIYGWADRAIAARINLATFDPEYRTNVTQIADDLQKSRPTIYGWADRAIAATIHSLRNIRTGRPPKERDRTNGSDL